LHEIIIYFTYLASCPVNLGWVKDGEDVHHERVRVRSEASIERIR
jgi:hypothetical protein